MFQIQLTEQNKDENGATYDHLATNVVILGHYDGNTQDFKTLVNIRHGRSPNMIDQESDQKLERRNPAYEADIRNGNDEMVVIKGEEDLDN